MSRCRASRIFRRNGARNGLLSIVMAAIERSEIWCESAGRRLLRPLVGARRSRLSAGLRRLRRIDRPPSRPLRRRAGRGSASSSDPIARCSACPFSHDLGAGHPVSAEAIADPPPFDRLRSAAIHDGVARDSRPWPQISRPHRSRADDGRWMLRASDGAVAACDAIVPVPLHRCRLLARKFNQAAELARAIWPGCRASRFCRRRCCASSAPAQQVGLGAAAREDNVRGAFRGRRGRRERRVRQARSCWSTMSIRPARRSRRRHGR